MIKVLHTSDWHLGHTLYGYDRTEEQKQMLDQLNQIVAERQPDVLLVSGDVFHTSQPSATHQALFSEAIMKFHNSAPEMEIIVTAGNHDSASKHEIFRIPWSTLKVQVLGSIKSANPEEHIFHIPGKGYVVAIPYAYERNIPEGFYQTLLDCVAEKNKEGLPVVMSAHTTLMGSNIKGHDGASEYIVGGIEYLDIEKMGSGYDYLALGHIHNEQTLDKENRVRYCGTPLAINFDEKKEHSVSMVTLEKHGDIPEIETILIESPVPLVTLPETDFAPWEETKALFEAFPDDKFAYIRLNVKKDSTFSTTIQSEAQQIAEHKKCHFCLINYKGEQAEAQAASNISMNQLKTMSLLELAEMYATSKNEVFTDEMKAMLNEVEQSINQE